MKLSCSCVEKAIATKFVPHFLRISFVIFHFDTMKGIVWVEEPNENSLLGKKKKRRVGKRKIEFVGWGSRPLIEFIEAIGKDVTTKHSQHEVAALIIKYINENNLFCPQRKKKVLCDNRLFALFAKKSMFRTKIYDMLEEHFAENHDESEIEFTDSSDEENYRENKISNNVQMKKVPQTPKSFFAAVVPDNIKLVYLKKSLVQEFLQVPESFDCKIVGSFVRMSSDPFDIYQKNRFQLQLVTGVEKVSEAGGVGSEVRLRVANYFKEVPISMLSDENFTDEEIEDVHDRIKAGVLKRLTVVELESKAQMLHINITKHWIAKELTLLKKRIDHANDKGWRRELHGYLERRKLLQTPSEVEKLLLEIPQVVAEELEPEACENAEGNGCSPTSILRGTSDVSSTDASGSGDLANPSQVVTDDLPTPRRGNGEMNNHVIVADDLPTPRRGNGEMSNHVIVAEYPRDLATPSQAITDDLIHILSGQNEDTILTKNPHGRDDAKETSMADWLKSPTHIPKQVEEIDEQPANFIQQGTWISNRSSTEMRVTSTVEKSLLPGEISLPKFLKENPQPPVTTTVVINLSDDESEFDEPSTNAKISGECPDSAIWCYLDPRGVTQGPFSLSALKRWRDANYFHPGFTVWRNGESPDDAVLLADVIGRFFHS